MKSSTGLILVLAIASTASILAHAQTPLPGATFREEIGRAVGDVGPILDPTRPESDSYSFNHTVGMHTGTGTSFVQILSSTMPSLGGPLLHVRGSAFNSGLPPVGVAPHLYSGGAGARAEVEYYFRVIAAPTVLSIPILLPVNFSLHLERSGSAATGLAEWTVDVRREASLSIVAHDTLPALLGPSLIGDTRDATGTETLAFTAFNGGLFGGSEYYRVHMVLRGASGWNELVGGADPASSSFRASLDPLPYVDPAFVGADLVRFEFSSNLFENVAVVPEPGSLALLGLGLPILGVFLRRRKALR